MVEKVCYNNYIKSVGKSISVNPKYLWSNIKSKSNAMLSKSNEMLRSFNRCWGNYM